MLNKEKLILGFEKKYHEKPTHIFESYGRLEIIGNHTDHNHGLAIVAGCSLPIYGAVRKTNSNKVRVFSVGHGSFTVYINSLEKRESEYSRSSAIVRGLLKAFIDHGYKIGGFDLFCRSEIFEGAGVSSSAAFELLISEILNALYNEDKVSRIELAVFSQFAEYEYFGKPCGILDQIGSSFGGINYVDFDNPKKPIVESTKFPFPLRIVLTSSGGSHGNLTPLYAEIPSDMFTVAEAISQGKSHVLRDVDEKKFYETISNYGFINERQKLRAEHYFEECHRVTDAFEAVKNNDIDAFIKAINDSGLSSSYKLKNTMVPGEYEESPEKALDIARELAPKSAHRVHGGGFKGTIISFVREEEFTPFVRAMKKVYGARAVKEVFIPDYGAHEVK